MLNRSRAPEAFRRPPLWSFQVLSSASPVTAEGAARLVVSGASCRASREMIYLLNCFGNLQRFPLKLDKFQG